MPNQFTIDKEIIRECYACASNKTLVNGNGRPSWYLNRPSNLVLCQRCYTLIIQYPRVAKERATRLMWFKGKQITLKQKPRTGICQTCNRQGLTHMHHLSYDDVDPMKFTLELCPSCHAKETWKEFVCMKQGRRKDKMTKEPPKPIEEPINLQAPEHQSKTIEVLFDPAPIDRDRTQVFMIQIDIVNKKVKDYKTVGRRSVR